MLNDDTVATSTFSAPTSLNCVCGAPGCDGSCVVQQEAVAPAPLPVFSTGSAICSCAQHDPIAAAYEAWQAENNEAVVAIEPDTTLSSQADDQQVMYSGDATSTSTTSQSTQSFILVQPIPDVPNPNPDGFTNTAFIPNLDRITFVADSGNSIIDTLALSYAWKGDTITYSFNVQDIDNNGIADFDEGGLRDFHAGMLANVTTFTGVDFWERPDGEGTIKFILELGGRAIRHSRTLGRAGYRHDRPYIRDARAKWNPS